MHYQILGKIIVSLIILCFMHNQLQAKVKFKDIKFAPDFYIKSIKLFIICYALIKIP